MDGPGLDFEHVRTGSGFRATDNHPNMARSNMGGLDTPDESITNHRLNHRDALVLHRQRC